MKSMSIAPIADLRVVQLIDANLDRAREGLRVVEDWCRFGLDRQELVVTLKDWRQQLGRHHLDSYKQARSTATDQGIGLSHPAQQQRQAPWHVVAANCARVQEALRVLEEFARHPDPELATTAATIRYGLYDLEVTVLHANAGAKRREQLQACRLYLITSTQIDLCSRVRAALEAGIGMVQYRNKEGSDLERLSEAKELAAICRKHGALFIINDRIDIALAVDADGVHLGQDDLPTDVARNLIGAERLLGRSTQCLAQLDKAENEGCDYVGVGPVYATATKPERQPVGLDYVKEASKATQLPWFAIGGINISTLGAVINAGAERVAVVGAVMNSKDPAAASLQLVEALT
ncbi:MAG TPA: thiamine phosphate synthase [Prochlorococcaceae cyanobacterium Gl_MAG_24]|nr:thiamine phosphate synthase [Prochlorococcaceae cyanobacterium Gl_MAG_24]